MHDTSTRSPTSTGLDAGADRFDRADRFVTEDPAGGDRRDVTFQDVEVGAADRHRIDADDGVGVIDDARLGNLLPRLVTWSVVDDCIHGVVLLCVGNTLDGTHLAGPWIGPDDPAWRFGPGRFSGRTLRAVIRSLGRGMGSPR